jgi:heme/copper-type cytochrome/quinol oxidase subunit 2
LRYIKKTNKKGMNKKTPISLVVVVWAIAFMNTKRKKEEEAKWGRVERERTMALVVVVNIYIVLLLFLFMCYMVVVVRKNEVFCAAVKNSFLSISAHTCVVTFFCFW